MLKKTVFEIAQPLMADKALLFSKNVWSSSTRKVARMSLGLQLNRLADFTYKEGR